ncbi:MAG: hypothetical protein K2X27_06245 [Candidatus Obscuribacterales bacterium]|nr:hypothetical protein [Candidatus Obscuribacterales bacterium]
MPTRFARHDYFPQWFTEAAAEYLALFKHRYGYIRKPFNGNGWVSAPEKWRLTDTEILKAAACVHPHSYLGARFGKSTRFAVLDIDAQSKYHSKRELRRLIDAVVDAGLMPPSIYRSSHSGGWHLYLFFDEPISSVELRRELFNLLSFHGFKIGKGQLEIFPNTNGDSLGLGCRLPLQDGFAWINPKTFEMDEDRECLSPVEAMSKFLQDAQDSNSYQDFRSFKDYVQNLEERKDAVIVRTTTAPVSNVVPIRNTRQPGAPGEHRAFVKAVFHRLPPGIIVDNWYKGRLYHLNGLTGPSQRAEAIECVGHYLFYGDPSRDLPALGYGYEQEREWAITEFLEAHHNGQSHEINRGLADAYAQVGRAANWVPPCRNGKEPVKYAPERPIAWVRANANRKSNARKRIAEALEGLKKRGRSFTTVELQEAAGCARKTLYGHQDLWRAEYERLLGYQDLADGFFATCLHEYNCVEGGGSQKTSPPSASSSPDMPPGRLAARRLVYEMTMRAERSKNRAVKEAVESREASEKAWREKVTRLSEMELSGQSIAQLKAFLTVLMAYLSISPDYDCQVFVQGLIAGVRKHIAWAEEQPFVIVRPPP